MKNKYRTRDELTRPESDAGKNNPIVGPKGPSFFRYKKKLLIIAGLDPSGGAGLVRDLGVAHKMGMETSAIVTALTSQNSRKFFRLQAVTSTVLSHQLLALGDASNFSALKIGMMANEKLVMTLAAWLKKSKGIPPIVLDPVLESTSGGLLLTKRGRRILWSQLLPLCSLWTPNLPEAKYFLQNKMPAPAHVATLLKGGHSTTDIVDIYMSRSERISFSKKRWLQKKRGTGCALSTLIACHLAMGKSLAQSVKMAEKNFEKFAEG